MAQRIRIEREDLTPALKEKAAKELRETPEVVEDALTELRKLLKNEKSIYYKDTDDILIRYLRPTKYYPESALALMKREAQFKEENKDLLKDLMPQQLEDVMINHNVVNVLVDRDQDGRRIMLHRAGGDWDTKKVSSDEVFQLFYLIHQGAVLEPATQVNGVVVILDFKNMGMAQVKQLGPSFSKRLLTFIQDAMPLRLKEVHIVNEPWVFKFVWAIFSPLIKPKLKGRLTFHGENWDKLHKFIPKQYLPADFGGSLPKMDYSSKDWYPVLRSLDDIIKENNTFGLVKK